MILSTACLVFLAMSGAIWLLGWLTNWGLTPMSWLLLTGVCVVAGVAVFGGV